MALTKYTKDTSIIGQLGTRPEDRPGMTDQQLKDKFDENALNWKEFWNNTASKEIDALIASIKGAGWTNETLKGLADLIEQAIGNPYYGKFSQMSTSTVGTTSAVMNFSEEANDDFSVIDLAISASRMTIPAKLNGKKVRFKFIGTLGTNKYSGTGSSVSLRKNGSDIQVLGSITAATGAGNNITGTFESIPVTVATDDYFELYATVAGGSSPTSVTCNAFIMEVLG